MSTSDSPRLRIPQFNRFTGTGRVVRDPELKHTSGGIPYAKGSLVFEEAFKKNDQWEKKATFLDFTVWGAKAEKVAAFHKGDGVLVEGRLQQEEWDDKATGQKRSKLTLNAYTFDALFWATEKQDAPRQDAPRQAELTEPANDGPVPEDDIPF